MATLKVIRGFGRELDQRLRLKTYPMAVKLLRSEADIPRGAIKPKRDIRRRINTCQAFGMSRREGTTVAQLKEDMWCFEPVIAFGLEKPPQYFLDGYTRWPDTVSALATASKWAHEFPRLEVGKYIGIVSAPLSKADFEPDLVVIYCEPSQANLLLMAVACQYGGRVPSILSGHAGCVNHVVPAMKSGNFNVSIPCLGDHNWGMTRDEEMVFTSPLEKVESLLEGLRYLEKYMVSMPSKPLMKLESWLPDSYHKIAKMLGMEGHEKF